MSKWYEVTVIDTNTFAVQCDSADEAIDIAQDTLFSGNFESRAVEVPEKEVDSLLRFTDFDKIIRE